jgi:site-specific DNA-adenine methylase
MKTQSALSYFGSDSEVASGLAALLNRCSHVTIPFVGGASIIPHLTARALVCNDLNELAINFYRHASGIYGEECQKMLVERCKATLSHPSELSDATKQLSGAWAGSWGQAWAYWAVCWISRKGKGGTRHVGGTPSVRWSANGGTNASRIRRAAEDLEEWAKHFERCEWTCLDFRSVLAKVKDHPKCGVYCDPPWVDADYLHCFSEEDHEELRNFLLRFVDTTVVVRYGDHPFIRDIYSSSNWSITDANSRNQANKIEGEIWITNKKCD